MRAKLLLTLVLMCIHNLGLVTCSIDISNSIENSAVLMDSTISTSPENISLIKVETVEEKLQKPMQHQSDSFTMKSELPFADSDDILYIMLQKGLKDIYFAIKNNAAKQKKEDILILEENFREKIQDLEIDLNSKILTLESNTNSRIHTLTEQHAAQRKEDIQTFSDNLNQIQKAHQIYVETQRGEIQQIKSVVETASKGQANLSSKMSQLQKSIHNLDAKVIEMVRKHSDDTSGIQETQKSLAVIVDEIEKDIRVSETEIEQMQSILEVLEKAATEDNKKLRKTLIRDQKQEPIQNSIRYLRNKNVGAAVKQWRAVEQITDDLKDTLPADITKIIDEAYGRNPNNLMTIFEFTHRAVMNGDRRLKEAAYGFLLLEMEAAKHLGDGRKLMEVFTLAQYMKSDLGATYNTSSSTAEIVSRLPEAVRLITFEKVKLVLPSRGYLRVGSDRKVNLVPEDARFIDRDEILWLFEYDKDKGDGAFYIKSDKLQKYLVTVHEGFNSYGFSRQALFMTGNKKENGTRFEVLNVTGEHVLLKSVFYNGYLTWKSNIQTIYGDDDSYFVLLEDRKNGPSPYWLIEAENEFK